VNRTKALKQELAREGFCFDNTLQSLGKAIGARTRNRPLRGVIKFGNSLNKRAWIEEELSKGNIVRLQNHATEGLIY